MAAAPGAGRSRSTSPGPRLSLDPQESLGHFGGLGPLGGGGDSGDGETPTNAKAKSWSTGTGRPSTREPVPNGAPSGLSMSKLTSPVLVANRHGDADPVAVSARSPRSNESAEAFLERHNVAAILEGFVAGVIATRPDNVALFGAEFFASAVAITNAGARRLSNNPLVPHAPEGSPRSGGAGQALPVRAAQARLGGVVSPEPGADAAGATAASGYPRHAHGILSPASGLTPSDMSLQNSASVSRRGSEGTHLSSSAAAIGASALLPTAILSADSNNNSLTCTSPQFTGGHLPDVPEAVPSTGGRPNKRQLKRLFSAPPDDPPIAFDDRAPARKGNYGVVRRATWGDHGTVAVKQVPVQATWTLDELRHLKACQTDRQLAGSLRQRNAASPSNTPGQYDIAPPASSGPLGSPVTPSLTGAAKSARATPLASSQRLHWDVVHCLAVFYEPDANALWFVFEWVGETLGEAADAVRAALGFDSLASHVAAGPELRWQLESWTAGVVRQLLLALQHVHGHGKRVHLDVKPANVLIRRRAAKSVKVLAPADDAPVEPGSPGASSSGSHRAPKITEPAEDSEDEPGSGGAATADAPSAPSGGPPVSRVRRIREEVAATRSPFGQFGRSRSPGPGHAGGGGMDFDVVLADFGTAQDIGTPLQQLGDFKYIAPEIYTACDIEVENGGVPAAALVRAGVPTAVSSDDLCRPSCDSWSVGCLVIYCLEGYAPFDLGEDAVFTALRACWMQPTTQHPRLWSPELTNFLSHCFERDARLRPGADELLEHPWVRGA